MERGSAGIVDENKHLGEIEVAKGESRGACGMLLRVLALIFTLTAAILAGTNKQTKVVPVKIADTLPPLYVPLHAHWHYLSAYVYILVANAIACAYAAVSLLLAFANKGKRSKYLGFLIFILDAIMVALLFSGIGAGTAVGILGYRGNSHLQWNKVCNVFVRFCHQMVASIGLSFAGSLQFLLLLMIPMLRLHRRT